MNFIPCCSHGAETGSVVVVPLGIDKIRDPLHEPFEVIIRLEEADPRVPAASLVQDAGTRVDLRLQQGLMAVFVLLPRALHPGVGCQHRVQ